jgi:hypothetical protein
LRENIEVDLVEQVHLCHLCPLLGYDIISSINWKEKVMIKRAHITLICLLFFTASCNLPGGQVTQTPDLALTITAQALLLQTGTPVLTPQETGTPQFTSTPQHTGTPSVPTVTVSQNTNCRTGPGVQYDLISALQIGQSAEIVGKNTATNYWIIKTPGGSGTCWLWGQYATVSGNIAALPEVAIPPTPTPSPTPTLAPPAAVSNLTAAKVCIPLVLPNYQYAGSIAWQDNSNNEEGFNIYFNGGLFDTIGPNITGYPIPALIFPAGVPMTLGVEAFNDAGKAATKNVVVICP